MKYSEVDESKTPVDRPPVSISINTKLDQVALLRAAFRGVLEELGVSEMDSTLLQLAVSEVVNNAIEHGYQNDPSKKVEVVLVSKEKDIRIDIFDEAPPLPVNELKRLLQSVQLDDESESNEDSWTERGRGMQIVRRAVDNVELSRVSDRNCVTLHKHLDVHQ